MAEQGLVDSSERLLVSSVHLDAAHYVKRQKRFRGTFPSTRNAIAEANWENCKKQGWGMRDYKGHVKISWAFPSNAAGGHSKQKAMSLCNTKNSFTLAVLSVEFSSALSPVCFLFLAAFGTAGSSVKPSQSDCEAGQVPPASSHPGNICSSRESTFLNALQLLTDRLGRKCNW